MADAAQSLGTAILTLGTENDEFEKGLIAGKRAVEGFGGFAVTAIAGVVASMVTLGAASITAAAGFEKSLSGIKSVSGANAEEMKGLSGLALQLGKDTSFSASEAAKGIEELVKGGVSIADIMGGAATSALNLAAAGEIDLAAAAEIAANSMSIFGLKGKDMENVVNQIAGAANASSLGVGDFRESLNQVGSIAATIGLSFDDTARSIAVMGAAGVKGSDAGTSLKTMLMGLQPQTKEQITLFEELGLITESGANAFFTAEGKAKSMSEISGVLSESLADLTDQQRVAALEIMFGSDAMRAGAIFAKAGAEGFDQMAESMGKVSAASVAEERLNNLSGSLEQLYGSLETAAIILGTAFLPLLKSGADAFTEIVNAATPFLETAGPRITDALGVGIEALQKFTEFIHNVIVPLLEGDVPGAVDVTIEYFNSLPVSADSMVELIQTKLGEFIQWIADNLPMLVETIAGWAKALVEWVGPMIPPLLMEMSRLREEAFAWVVDQIPGWIDQLGKWAVEFTAWIGPMIAPMLEELGKVSTRMLDWIVAQTPIIIEKFLGEWAPAAIAWIAEALINLLVELPGILLVLLNWVSENAPKVGIFFLDVGAAIVDGIMKGIGNLAGRLYDKMWELASGALNAVKGALGIGSPSKAFAELGGYITDGLTLGLENGKPSVLDEIGSIAQAAWDQAHTDFAGIGMSGNFSGAMQGGILSGMSAMGSAGPGSARGQSIAISVPITNYGVIGADNFGRMIDEHIRDGIRLGKWQFRGR